MRVGFVCEGKVTFETTLKRVKVYRDVRMRRMKELEEDIDSLNKRISIKEARCASAQSVKNYKLCDQLEALLVDRTTYNS